MCSLVSCKDLVCSILASSALISSYAREDKAYRKAGYKTVPLAENVQLQKIINAGLRKTNNLFENLTGTTANTASRQFENALDRAYMQITSGAFDYNTAIRTCIGDLAQKGIAYITYPSGHTDYLDVAVRRAALTGVGQTCGEMQLELAAEMDCDLVEVTAHNGARPEHAVWQGKVFSLSGKSPKYPDFVKSTGYGTGAGLKGWNCRHDFFPFFEDSKPAYTQAELAEFENRQVTYNGEKMTEYDATQKQRAMERRIRATKRELAGYDAGIAATTDDSLKAELQTAFDRKSVLLKRQEAVLKDFTRQTGLARDRAREQAYGFNKSVSQKAVQSNKRAINEDRLFHKNNRDNQNDSVLKTDTKADTIKQISDILQLNEVNIGIEMLPLESQQIVLSAISKSTSDFPMLKHYINSIQFDDKLQSIALSKSLTGQIVLGPKFKDFKMLESDYLFGVKLKFAPKGTSAESIVIHEIGHQIDGLLTLKGVNGGSVSEYGVIRTSERVQKEILSRLGLTDERLRELRKEYASKGFTGKDLTHAVLFERKQFITKHLSEYAATNCREFFAECYSEYMTSANPREAAKIFGEIFERMKGEL